MFGSATFLTPQYWVSQPNKHTQEPHHQRKFWDLFVTSSLPSTSTSVSATSLLPLLHLHRKGLLKRTDEGTRFQSAAVAPMSGASCAGDGEGLVVVRLPSSSGGDSFQLPPESSFIMFYRILQRAMRSITISNTIRNQNTG
jgi:hypothetical protein